MKTPDITPLQIGAALGWLAAQAVSFGWIDHAPDKAILSGAATVLAAVLALAEAHIRHGRATGAGLAAGKE